MIGSRSIVHDWLAWRSLHGESWGDVVDAMISSLARKISRWIREKSPLSSRSSNWFDTTGWTWAYKAFYGCCYCDEHDPSALDFHHLDRKSKVDSVSSMVGSDAQYICVVTEVKKCEVACANCHRKSHFRERFQLPALQRRGLS